MKNRKFENFNVYGFREKKTYHTKTINPKLMKFQTDQTISWRAHSLVLVHISQSIEVQNIRGGRSEELNLLYLQYHRKKKIRVGFI